ncbi:LysM peptidoglycan-binding domain-containing protein [Niallia taxi]|uniref:LysM peptidoglycan-binding domain-containing protein n=2 Tax=Niallia taxi TaxID=2499688 RepID=A0A3S2WZU2_9BACI|nr:LysM peptidoglycan-binding domain-containing protein [Niallia taxi]
MHLDYIFLKLVYHGIISDTNISSDFFVDTKHLFVLKCEYKRTYILNKGWFTMVEKIWRKHSYSIILIILSFMTCFVIALKSGHEDTQKYIKVTVSQGDSLWKISNQYENLYNMPKEEFMSWVEKHNDISRNQIQTGQELVIPVLMERQNTMLAAD